MGIINYSKLEKSLEEIMKIQFIFNDKHTLKLVIKTGKTDLERFEQYLYLDYFVKTNLNIYNISDVYYLGLFNHLDDHNVLTFTMFKQAVFKYLQFYHASKHIIEEPMVNNLFEYTFYLQGNK